MDSNWSGYILMIFGANLSIIHIKGTSVINSVQLFKTKQNKPTDHLIIFVNFGNYESIFLRFGGSHVNRRLMSEI